MSNIETLTPDAFLKELNNIFAKSAELATTIGKEITFDTTNFPEMVDYTKIRKTEEIYSVLKDTTSNISKFSHLANICDLIITTLKSLRTDSKFKDVALKIYNKAVEVRLNHLIENMTNLKEAVLRSKDCYDKQFRVYSSLMFNHNTNMWRGDY